MSIKRVSNSRASSSVDQRQEFIGSNTQGLWSPNCYVVYSYGAHWPLYAYVHTEGRWYGHTQKYGGITTAKHTGQLRPSGEVIYLDSVAQLNQKISEAAK